MRKNLSAAAISPASWAHKYGISKENNGSAVMGLNPNLNIEDEYIENLLKQIHFMSMEIKLLKEKQTQSNGNSLWGILNRSNQPLTQNLLDSNQKYQSMKKTTDLSLHTTEYHNLQLADQQNAIIKKMNYLEAKIQNLQNLNKEGEKIATEKNGKIGSKIQHYSLKLKGMLTQKEVQSKKFQDFSDQYEHLIAEVERQQFHNNHDIGKIKNQEDIQEIILNDRITEINAVKVKISKIREGIQGNMEFQRAKGDEAMINENMVKVTKNIASAEFQLLQINQAIKLAQSEKEKEVLERKKQMEEYEALKIILFEIKTLNHVRISQEVALRQRESVDIQKGEHNTKRLEKNIEEIKKKLARSEDSQKVLKHDVEQMEREIAKLKAKKEIIYTKLTKRTTENDQQDTLLSGIKNELRKMEDQFEKMTNSDFTSTCELNEIEAEIVFLRQRKEYLSQFLDLKQTLNHTRLQQLQKVVQKNKDLNQTVGTLMTKWQEIRQFSKI